MVYRALGCKNQYFSPIKTKILRNTLSLEKTYHTTFASSILERLEVIKQI